MKLFKLSLSVLGLLVLIIILSVGFLFFFLDPNQLKPVLIEEVSTRTSYQLVIDGNLSWSFYPKMGIAAPHMLLKKSNNVTFVDLHGVYISMPLSQLWHYEKKLKGDIVIDTMQLMKLHLNKAHINLYWKNKILTLDPITASLYGGEITGKVLGRDFNTMPSWTSDIKLNHVELQNLLQDLNGANPKFDLSGTGSLQLQLGTKGNDPNQLLQNLNGNGNLNIQNGIVKGFNLNYLVDSADALINKTPLTLPTEMDQTVFDTMQASYTIKNGVGLTDDLLLTSTSFTTKGEGSLDFIHKKMDFKLEVTPLHHARVKWMVPVLVQGDLQSPTIRLDVLSLKTMVAREQLEKVQKKLEDKIKDLPGKANQFFEKLLGH